MELAPETKASHAGPSPQPCKEGQPWRCGTRACHTPGGIEGMGQACLRGAVGPGARPAWEGLWHRSTMEGLWGQGQVYNGTSPQTITKSPVPKSNRPQGRPENTV